MCCLGITMFCPVYHPGITMYCPGLHQEAHTHGKATVITTPHPVVRVSQYKVVLCGPHQEAHTHGKATVITAPQPDAEDYCEGMRANGLVASIEPASDKD
jgi:ATP-dependent Clp protease adapter protein ClpS